MNELSRFTGFKRGNAPLRALGAGFSWVAMGLAGCATTPTEPVTDRLDPDTATTVTILSRPIELVAASLQQGARSSVYDPFAYMAPFETDKMGARDLYLWVSTPQTRGDQKPPQVLCNGQTLTLQPLSDAPKVDLSQLSLSREPYDAPVPWSVQWYFKLSEDGLKCLTEASSVTVDADALDGTPAEFTTSERKTLASLDAFARR